MTQYRHHYRDPRPRDFGMDTHPTSARWSDISKGPTRTEFLTHLAKLANFVPPKK